MAAYYLENTDDALKELNSSEQGLFEEEAAARLRKNGKNKLEEAPRDSLVKKFFKSLMDPLVVMLLAAAAISAVTTVVESRGHTELKDWADLFIILFVVIINTVLGVVQESKAEEAIDALMEMTALTSKVLRDGKQVVIKSEDLVTGDVVILEAGDAVPADCRILESHSIKAEESALTGESVPVSKLMDVIMLRDGERDVPLGDRKNMLYSGSTVVYGRGKAVVTSTGMNTEMGKIAKALTQADNEQTPLQIKMTELSKVLTKLVVGICIFVFLFNLCRTMFDFSGGLHFVGIDSFSHFASVALDTFILAVALAVAAIPEGLPAVVTIILSIGVTSMSKRKALIRKLPAVETLGCTQIICTDKTGTLTQNRMTVVDSFTDNPQLLAKAMALCSDAVIKPGEEKASGEPTECALVNYASEIGTPKAELEQAAPRIGEAPFDSMRKMMSTVHAEGDRYIQYTKGACEILVSRCTGILRAGQVMPLNDALKQEIAAQSKAFADRALRVLAAGYRVYTEKPASFEADDLEQELIFIGFVGMIDPCRPEVVQAIAECRNAGIRPIMITGDHKDTAVAIGKEIGILRDASEAIVGAELENYTDEELIELVPRYSVYARVQPEHKTRIVRAWKARGKVTAMTGDGVNDAPSIKAADIGIGMGITGTDVTKGVADMVLADDNFATIVNAVEEGRKIYDNVCKVLQFQISSNMAEVVSIFIASILGVQIFTPAHLLWINMVTDSAPGLALGMEKAEGDLMKRKPRSFKESIFANGAGVSMIGYGLLMTLLIITSFFVGHYMESGRWEITASPDGMTMAFLTMNFIEMFHAIAMRSLHGSIFKLKHQNWWLIGALGLTCVLTLGVIYIPFLASMFKIQPVSLSELLVALGLAAVHVPLVELFKWIRRRFGKSMTA